MKIWTRIFYIIATFSIGASLCAENLPQLPTDSISDVGVVSQYEKIWVNLAPTHLKLHYAGSMGFMSLGIGLEYGKRKQWETDIYLGYLPKFDGPSSELTFTLKENFSATTISINDKWDFEPFTVGFFLTWTTGEHLWGRLPDEYPAKYYYFTTALRMNACIGERITHNFSPSSKLRSIGFFYEFNTNDLYVASIYDNSNLGVFDIMKLSFGLKLNIR